MFYLVRGGRLLGDMKYLMKSVKRAAAEVEIWTEDNWDEKIVNSFYTIISVRFIFKRNKRFDSFNWSLVVRDVYTSRGYIIGELNKKQDEAHRYLKKKR